MSGSRKVASQQDRSDNQAAFRRLKASLDVSFPPGRYVAIHEGEVIADAESFDALHHRLRTLGIDPRQSLIVQAHHDYPEQGVIFI